MNIKEYKNFENRLPSFVFALSIALLAVSPIAAHFVPNLSPSLALLTAALLIIGATYWFLAQAQQQIAYVSYLSGFTADQLREELASGELLQDSRNLIKDYLATLKV